jgi:tetratricopeptide (TPR) repeat protein
LATEIVNRFPNPRGYRALARLYELAGEIDIGIAWGLKALQVEPEDQETRWQVGELFSRIGDFVDATKYDPEPVLNQLWLQRRYAELVDVGQDYVIENPGDLKAKGLLAFGYNATEDFAAAKYLLERMGMPPRRGTDPINEGTVDTQYPQYLASYIDALQSLGGNDSLVIELATYLADEKTLYWNPYAKSWWTHTNLACAKSQLGQYAEALDAVEVVVAANGLVWSPLLQDSPCFKRLSAEPRYKAALEHVEQRKKQLRERLPATLREFGVAAWH